MVCDFNAVEISCNELVNLLSVLSYSRRELELERAREN